MRVKVIGTSQDDRFQTDFDLNETFLGLAGDDSFWIAWLAELDRFKGGLGRDTLAMDWHFWAEGGNALLDNGVWFDGGRGIDSFEYRIIYEPEDHDIDLAALGGTLKSVEHVDFFLTDYQSRNDPDGVAEITVRGTDEGEDILATFTKAYDTLDLTIKGGKGSDRLGANSYASEANTVVMNGGKGNDTIFAITDFRNEDDSVKLYGGSGNDKLAALYFGAKLFGGKGKDTLWVRAEQTPETGIPTRAKGGAGADTFVLHDDGNYLADPARIVDFSANDRLVIWSTIANDRDAVSLTLTDDPVALEYDIATGQLLQYSGKAVLQFDPGTVIREDQVEVAHGSEYSDVFWF